MEWYEVREFIDSMKLAESYLSELAARDSELRYAGLGSSKLWDSYREAASAFDGFDRNLYELTRLAKFVDQGLHDRIAEISRVSSLADGIAQIAVTVKIAERRRETEIVVRKAAATAFDFVFLVADRLLHVGRYSRRRLYFDDSEISLSKILVGLNRLIPLAEEVLSKYYLRLSGDDEIFKPANISINHINLYVDNAIIQINKSDDIGPEFRGKLLEYLEEIKVELSSDTPKWKKIVGALVIVSTILSGLAVAPQAYENVQKAVGEILGTSIDKQPPSNARGILKLPEV